MEALPWTGRRLRPVFLCRFSPESRGPGRGDHHRLATRPFCFSGYNCRVEFFFPEDNLQRMTPAETRITSLTAEPYPDGQRLRVNIEITPFQTRPHIEVSLSDGEGNEVATASIIEPMSWKLEFTMHLRGARANPFSLQARLFYPEGPQAEPVHLQFELPPIEHDHGS
jgi:hypothetical protein